MGAHRSNMAYIDIESDEELIIRRKRSPHIHNRTATYIFPTVSYVPVPTTLYNRPPQQYTAISPYNYNLNSNTKNYDKVLGFFKVQSSLDNPALEIPQFSKIRPNFDFPLLHFF
ncbi:hypothetical protein BpHYR1_040272 [Brachionus plicatilis]|uniref:Uncharacterized protein n=1 Tax=Brachionus plicatilis TaxID=10195 RepID=A0A3M7R862_BRAPC|nr:hypothetical protein BpHYR1_040272 [Brachionus plicatilis]